MATACTNVTWPSVSRRFNSLTQVTGENRVDLSVATQRLRVAGAGSERRQAKLARSAGAGSILEPIDVTVVFNVVHFQYVDPKAVRSTTAKPCALVRSRDRRYVSARPGILYAGLFPVKPLLRATFRPWGYTPCGLNRSILQCMNLLTRTVC